MTISTTSNHTETVLEPDRWTPTAPPEQAEKAA